MHSLIEDGDNGSADCFHCGGIIPDDSHRLVKFNGVNRPLCCDDCEHTARSIIDSGKGNYYQQRTGTAPIQRRANLPSSVIYDEPEMQARYTQSNGDTTQISMSVTGLHCGACVGLLESSLVELPGVLAATVNLATGRMDVTYDATLVTVSQIMESAAQTGYQAQPFEVDRLAASRKQYANTRLKQLCLAGLAAMQTMMFTLPGYLTGAGEMETRHQLLFQWAGLMLTVPVLLYSAQPFWKGAWRSIRNRQPGMDVPVSIAIVCAAIASIYNMVNGYADVYFDSIAMFVFLLLGARYLEWSIRQRSAASLSTLDASVPQTARLITNDKPAASCCSSTAKDPLNQTTELVPSVRLKPDDLIAVHSGERVPVDGIVAAGQSSIDSSLLTGESLPIPIAPGDAVPGGAVVSETPVVLKVTDTLEDSALSTISRLANRGSSEKPPLIRRTDRIATVFVSVLLVVAIMTGLVWLQVDPQRALPIAIAVLVVSCPCALSLATPATLAAATAGLLRRHVLITRSHTLETMTRVTDIVLDKTGTVTLGEPALTEVRCSDEITRAEAIRLAAHLETGSGHPLAKVIIRAAENLADAKNNVMETTVADNTQRTKRFLPDNCNLVTHTAGAGLSTTLTDDPSIQIMLGSASWCGISNASSWRNPATEILSEVFLVAKHKGEYPTTEQRGEVNILARFSFEDPLKTDAPALVNFFQSIGIRVHLLSGDRGPVVQRVGRALGVAHHHVTAEASPSDKQVAVQAMQQQGNTVLMIGDGINDAPVLAAADVSIAFGDASALACVSADAVLLTGEVGDIASLYNSAQRASRIIWQNLYWAAGYNLLAIPLAALGMVPPWAAAIGMSMSSLLVAINASRAGSTAPLFVDHRNKPVTTLYDTAVA